MSVIGSSCVYFTLSDRPTGLDHLLDEAARICTSQIPEMLAGIRQRDKIRNIID